MIAAKELGEIIEVIPILGIPIAYVVKGTGKGIYYIVTSVGNILGKSLSTVGKIGKESSDLIVFTIYSTSTATEKTIEESGKIVSKVAHSLDKKKTRKNIKNRIKMKKNMSRKRQ